MEDPDKVSFFRRLAIKASHYPDTISETHQWVVLDLYGNKYLVINKINAIKDRLASIQIVND